MTQWFEIISGHDLWSVSFDSAIWLYRHLVITISFRSVFLADGSSSRDASKSAGNWFIHRAWTGGCHSLNSVSAHLRLNRMIYALSYTTTTSIALRCVGSLLIDCLRSHRSTVHPMDVWLRERCFNGYLVVAHPAVLSLGGWSFVGEVWDAWLCVQLLLLES